MITTEETIVIPKSQMAEILANLHTCQGELVTVKESRRICCECEQRMRVEANRLRGQVDTLTAALEKLAKLGNEPMPGNSIGNRIAQEALEAARRL